MKEWHRTIVLVVLLIALIGFIIWLRTGFETDLAHKLAG